LALAYHTHDPQATAGIGVNISVSAADALRVFDALLEGVTWVEADLTRVLEEEQVRLWWGRNPVDLEAVATVLTSLVGDDARADRLRSLG
jgi:hypothetical protein